MKSKITAKFQATVTKKIRRETIEDFATNRYYTVRSFHTHPMVESGKSGLRRVQRHRNF